jgi:hypothetical protein
MKYFPSLVKLGKRQRETLLESYPIHRRFLSGNLATVWDPMVHLENHHIISYQMLG